MAYNTSKHLFKRWEGPQSFIEKFTDTLVNTVYADGRVKKMEEEDMAREATASMFSE